MIIHTCEQRSPEWYAIRAGKITSSIIADVMAGGKGITRRNAMIKLIAERMTGICDQNGYSNGYMQWGIEHEPEAKDHYEALNFVNVRQVGFVEMDEWVGCSPDGLVGEDGLIELKCPASHTHIEYILADRCPPEYVKQIQHQLWVTGRQWCDFLSYDPRLKEKPMFVKRVERDESKIQEIAESVGQFIEELKELERRIRNDK